MMINDTTLNNDKRLFERFSSRFPARFKDSYFDYGTNVSLRDASAQGARIVCKDRLYINDTIFLEVQLPDGKDPMVLKGQVVWARNEELDIWDVGLKFFKIDLRRISRLYKYIPD